MIEWPHGYCYHEWKNTEEADDETERVFERDSQAGDGD